MSAGGAGTTRDRCQVAIVGGGPVGVALGIELAQRHVSCVVLERNAEVQNIPKGQLLTGRTVEHFYFWNCLDALRSARVLPAGRPINTITAYGGLKGQNWHGMSVAAPADPKLYFQVGERLPQYGTERVLRSRISELSDAQLVLGATVVDVQQDDAAGVEVTVASTEEHASKFFSSDGSEAPGGSAGSGNWVLRADYVVGCDGARSLVREKARIQRAGRDYGKKMMLVVFRSTELHDQLESLPDATAYRVMRPELAGWWQFFGRVDLGESFFFHAPVPAATAIDAFDPLPIMQEAAGFPFSAEIGDIRFWEGRIMLADAYRSQRMFIAGDAAHQHPPYGAYGLNTGLEDVTNLGWKLAAALRGWGGEALLDSYEAERRPVFADVGDLIASGIEADRRFLDSFIGDRALNTTDRAATSLEQESSPFRLQREPSYGGSPIVVGTPGGRTGAMIPETHAARPGNHLAPTLLTDGENVFAHLGSGFTLIASANGEISLRAWEDAATSCDVPLKIIDGSRLADECFYEARLVLVRPDQYVAWCGDSAPADIAELLSRVSGHRSAVSSVAD